MGERRTASSVDLLLNLPRSGGRRRALEHGLRDAIWQGRLTAGARLPSTRALAERLGLSRGTVVAAYDQLAVEGYLSIRHGSGTRVAALPPRVERTALPPPQPSAGRTLDLTVG